MDLVNGVLTWVGTPVMVASLLLFYPPYYLFTTCYSFLSWLFPEDLARKVVLITGASSGIGEQLAHQYAMKRSSLVLVARRESSLRQAADRALEICAGCDQSLRQIGPSCVQCWHRKRPCVGGDSRCYKLHFSARCQLLGLCSDNLCCPPTSQEEPRKDRGHRICHRMESCSKDELQQRTVLLKLSNSCIHICCWNLETMPIPHTHIYSTCYHIYLQAANAALINFFETLRTELGNQVGITIVTPGWVESEMSKGKYLKEHGQVEVDQDLRDAQIGLFPVEYAKNCAKAMVQAARQGERYLTVPAWFRAMYLWRVFAPEVVEACYRLLYMHGGHGARQPSSKAMAESGGKQLLYPASLRSDNVKNE